MYTYTSRELIINLTSFNNNSKTKCFKIKGKGKMKKLIATILVAVLALATVACGSAKEEGVAKSKRKADTPLNRMA